MKRRSRILLALGSVSALGAICFVGFARGPGEARTKSARAAPTAVQAAHPRQGEVLALSRDRGASAQQRLVELYGSLAGDPAAVGVRRQALRALFAEPSVGLRLKRVLDAVAADETPVDADPLFPELVEKLAEQFTPELFDKGRDLMMMEQRARPKHALVASFVDLAKSNQIVREDHRNALLTDLIDLHPLVTSEQQPQIREAVRVLGGNDPADLLAGKGLRPGESLELQAEYEKQLQAAMNQLVGPKR